MWSNINRPQKYYAATKDRYKTYALMYDSLYTYSSRTGKTSPRLSESE